MPRTRTVEIFRYPELTGAARDRARDWVVEGLWEFMEDDLRERFKEMLDEAGFPNAENIYFSLGHVQGDGVTFSVKHLDLRTWLKAQHLVEKFRDLYDDDNLNIHVGERGRGFNPPRVSVEPTHSPSPEEEKRIAALEEAIQESADAECRAMTDEGYAFISATESDEAVAEHAEANDYEFDDKGRPA